MGAGLPGALASQERLERGLQSGEHVRSDERGVGVGAHSVKAIGIRITPLFSVAGVDSALQRGVNFFGTRFLWRQYLLHNDA